MKREFITNLLPDIDKEKLDAIMAENGKDIETHKNTIATLTTERDGLKTQLSEANDALKSFKDMDVDGIKSKAAELETKYATDTQALKDQLDAANYGFAVKEAVSGLKFTSESARKAFVAELTAKKLPLSEGKLLGLDDFSKTYKETDPGAFAEENDGKAPTFAKGGSGGPAPSASAYAKMSDENYYKTVFSKKGDESTISFITRPYLAAHRVPCVWVWIKSRRSGNMVVCGLKWTNNGRFPTRYIKNDCRANTAGCAA